MDLTKFERVGLGSVCRRQNTGEITQIVTELYNMGLRLHGFGVKKTGVHDVGHMLVSADSMAWSKKARIDHTKLDGCTHKGVCSGCKEWAMKWGGEFIGS